MLTDLSVLAFKSCPGNEVLKHWTLCPDRICNYLLQPTVQHSVSYDACAAESAAACGAA